MKIRFIAIVIMNVIATIIMNVSNVCLLFVAEYLIACFRVWSAPFLSLNMIGMSNRKIILKASQHKSISTVKKM